MSLSFEERARELVSKMTLEEKITQTVYTSAAIERLGIPAYNWWNEALHGVARAGVATMFPQAIGMAATFDEELLQEVGEVIAHEGRAKYNTNSKYNDRDIYKGLTFWSPNINIFRDPRWGRGHETYGEDPYLTSRLGVGFIKGVQGNDPKYLKAAACAKHFAVHSGPERLRHEFNAEVSQQDLHETYLPAFKAAVEEGQVEIVMGAYNRTNGEPCCGSKTLFGILRDEWNFKGHVTSDCWAIKDFHEFHHVTSTAPESVAMAINNGCDLNCGNMFYNLNIAVNEGLVTEETIDKAVIRLLTTRMKLGLFDDFDSVSFNKIGYLENDTPENNRFALEVAKRSMVLLKNDSNYLPLSKEQLKTVAVIGPNADSRAALEGNYFGTASQYITVLDGIRSELPESVRLLYAPGCHLFKNKSAGLATRNSDRMAEAIEAASLADVSIVCLGLDATIEGEEGDTSNAFVGGDKVDLKFPGEQELLLQKICELGKPVILVVLTGSAMDLSYADKHVKSIIQAWYPGGQGGKAVATLIFGGYSPSGRLPVTFYKSTEDLPPFEDYNMENRTYKFITKDPLYPFGFGLSYTSFEYSGLKVSKENSKTLVSVKVKNTGTIKGYEASQLYIKYEQAGIRVPNYSLKGIKNIELAAGEEQELVFTLTEDDLAIYDENGKLVKSPGIIKIFVGGSQPDGRSRDLTGKAPLAAEL